MMEDILNNKEHLEMDEKNVIAILNKADEIIRNANILESVYLDKFNKKNEYIKQPNLAIQRIDEYLIQIAQRHIEERNNKKIDKIVNSKIKEYNSDIADDLENTFVIDKTPEKSMHSLNSTLQLEQSYFEDNSLLADNNDNHNNSGSPTIDIITGSDLLKFTQSAYTEDNNNNDDDNNEEYDVDDNNETIVIENNNNNNKKNNNNNHMKSRLHKSNKSNKTKTPIVLSLNNDFEAINLTNSFNRISIGSINLPGNNDNDEDDPTYFQDEEDEDHNNNNNNLLNTSSLSQLYSEHVAEMSAKKKKKLNRSENNNNHNNKTLEHDDYINNNDDDWLDDDEMSSSLNKLYNVTNNTDTGSVNTNNGNNQQPMSIRVSVMKHRRKKGQQQRLNVTQLKSYSSTVNRSNNSSIANDDSSNVKLNTSVTTSAVNGMIESSSLNQHQYAAIIWMLLRERRVKIAKRLSEMVFGKSYYTDLLSNNNDGNDDDGDTNKMKQQQVGSSYDFTMNNNNNDDIKNNNILSFLHGGILADEAGLKKTATISSFMSIATTKIKGKTQHPSIIITSPSRVDLWRQVLSCVPNLKVHFYTKKKAARTHSVSILLDPTNYFDKYDVVVTTFSIITCNEVDSKTAVRKSAWIKRIEQTPSPNNSNKRKKNENKVTFLHLTFFQRVVLDQAHTFATTTSKKYIAIRNLKCHYRWCLCDDVPVTPRRLSTLLTFLTEGNDNKLSIEQIASIAAAKDVCAGSKYPKPNVIMLSREKSDILR